MKEGVVNKYDGNGKVVDEKNKVLLGLVLENDLPKIIYDGNNIAELIRYFGILSVEVPFIIQHLKAIKAREEKSNIVTPR